MIVSSKFPIVVLVGRTNVGKSTIFNRLANNAKSIVFDRDGVTRDYVQDTVEWQDKKFQLIDTGGIPLKPGNDPILKKVRDIVIETISKANIVLFTVDGREGLTEEDQRIAAIARKANKKIVLLINKIDNEEHHLDNIFEFKSLGFEPTFIMSALHGRGFGVFLEYLSATLEKCDEPIVEKDSYRVVIVGKPNVGKSSLMNELLTFERTIVSDIAGTTRESITEMVSFDSQPIELTDTAGVRRKKMVDDDLEGLMVKSSLRSVKYADIILLVIDGSSGTISDQELKLLFFASEHKKGIIIVFNKCDLDTELSQLNLEFKKEEYNFFLKKIPQVRISCKDHKNINGVKKAIRELWQRMKQPFHTTEVDNIVKEFLMAKPLYKSGELLRLFKIRHVEAKVPTFVLHVNHPEWFGSDQLGCIENILRSNYDLRGSPVNFALKKT